MQGLMMDMPLLITDLIRFADRNHGDTEIVSKTVEGDIHRYTYRDAHARARRLAKVLQALGVKPGDRVGTLAWNGYRHYELYYAISGIGSVINTINPRLFPDQIVYISNHAENSALFFDLTFVPLVEKLAPQLKSVKHYVLMTDRGHMPKQTSIPNLLCYEDLMAQQDDRYAWPSFDEVPEGVVVAVSWVGTGLVVRLVGVGDGEAMIVAAVSVVGEGLNSVAAVTGVGGGASGVEQPTRMVTIRARTSQVLAATCR